MSTAVKIALVGAVTLLMVDTAGAVLSAWTGLNYGWFSIASFAIYLVFSFLAARRSRWFYGAAIGAFLGLVESTVARPISWTIGPGKPEMDMDWPMIAISIVFVVIVGTALGLAGGAISLLKRSDA